MKGNYLPSDLNKFQILLTSYEVFLLDFANVILNVPFQFIIVDDFNIHANNPLDSDAGAFSELLNNFALH